MVTDFLQQHAELWKDVAVSTSSQQSGSSGSTRYGTSQTVRLRAAESGQGLGKMDGIATSECLKACSNADIFVSPSLEVGSANVKMAELASVSPDRKDYRTPAELYRQHHSLREDTSCERLLLSLSISRHLYAQGCSKVHLNQGILVVLQGRKGFHSSQKGPGEGFLDVGYRLTHLIFRHETHDEQFP